MQIGVIGAESAANDGNRLPDQAPRCRIELSLRSGSFAPGQPIDYGTIIHNTTRDPLTVWSSGYWPNHWIILMAEDGTEPALTIESKRCKLAFFYTGRDKNYPVLVPPGKSCDEGAHRLNNNYVLEPGNYRLQVLYSDDQPAAHESVPGLKGLPFRSNIVKFRVTATDGGAGRVAEARP